MHITLAFLGRVPDERLPDASAAVMAAARGAGAFEVALDRAGRFPATGRPHIVWLGATTGAERIVDVGTRVRAELDRRGLSYDAKPLQTHVTIARVREDAEGVDGRAVSALVRELRVPPLTFRAESVVLFESVLSPKGARYTPRTTAPLEVGGQR